MAMHTMAMHSMAMHTMAMHTMAMHSMTTVVILPTMKQNGRYYGILNHIATHWPQFTFGYMLMVAGLLGMAAAVQMRQFTLAWLCLCLFGITSYALMTTIWRAHMVYDRDGLRPHHALFEMSHVQPHDSFVYINLGLRQRVLELGRRLITGQAIVVDVYNPQLTSSSALTRARRRRPHPPDDPRFEWLDGSIDLLPLPNESVPVAIICQILNEFWQHGDRLALLEEVHRILPQNGRLLIAESVRSPINWLLLGPFALTLPTQRDMRRLLQQAGFVIRREDTLGDMIICYRAEKPTFSEARQLALQLDFQ